MVRMSLVTGFIIRCKKTCKKLRCCVYGRSIHDIEKTDATESQFSDDMIDLDPVPLTDLPTKLMMKHIMTNMTWVMLKLPHKLR